MRLKNKLSELWQKIVRFIPPKVYYKQSLFTKYMSVSLIIVFLSFLLLGTILTLVISNFWTNQQISELEQKTNNIAEYTVDMVLPNIPANGKPSFNISDEVVFRQTLAFTASDNNVDIMLLNSDCQAFFVASNDRTILEGNLISPEIAHQAIQTGKYSAKGTLDGIYKSDRYIVAMPLYFKQPNVTGKGLENTSLVGVAIVTADADDMSSITEIVLRLFILSAVAALSLSILAISIFSYNMVKPLKQMAAAAKQFGKGDFSVRVSETTNDEIGELAVSFNNMAESLSSSENTRKSFIANVSHELKTPMTTISGFIDGILDGTIPEEKQNYYLNIVSDEIKRLSRLVHSMLNLSRIDNGELKLNYRSFDLFSTLVNVVITFEREIDKKSIEIKGLDEITPKIIYGDKDLIHQVVYNLVENAVKFTDDGGYIEFNITENQTDVWFTIKNSGQGIKKAEIPLVFERFYKTDKSRSKDKKGLGLGLYLVRSIIRKHGGDISAESEYGVYTEFKFNIPKKQDKKA